MPFSLLHSRDDQHRFTGDPSSPPSLSRTSFRGTGLLHIPDALAGYHDQAIYDVACHNLVASSSRAPSDINMNSSDPPCDPRPVYNMDRVLQLLQDCLQNKQTAFWAEVSYNHKFEVEVTSTDALLTGFIRHIYSGDCVAGKGAECKDIVRDERWTHSMGIHMIDSTLEWLESRKLDVDQFVRICAALGLSSSAVRKERLLKGKLVDRRRQLLRVLDSAALSLPELLPKLGEPSSLTMLKSLGVAHGLGVEDIVTKDDGVEQVLGHITRGECAENSGRTAGCERIVKDAALRNESTVQLQVSVLSHVADIATKKQLVKLLDLHEINYCSTDKPKKLRAHLRKYIHGIQRGKLVVEQAAADAMERLRKLDDVRRTWPKLIPPVFKEKIIQDFRAATSSEALSSFTCACCARETAVQDRVRKPHSEIDLALLEGPATHWNDPSFPPPPPHFQGGPLMGKLLDPRGVTAEDGKITLELCVACSRALHRKSLPKHALANRMYTGPVPQELGDLTMVEECMIARARAKSWIVKLQEGDSDAASPTAQRGLKGHTIIYPQQPDKLARVLPPTLGETLTFICIIFVGSSNLTKEWL